MKNFSKRRGFTLIELLVVISIIGVLSTTVLATLSSARDRSHHANGLQYEGFVERTQAHATAVHLSFDDTSNLFMDSSGNGLNAVANDGTTPCTASTIKSPNGTTGCEFSGSSQAILVPHNSEKMTITSAGLTFMAWVYPTTQSAATRYIFGKRTNTNNFYRHSVVTSNGSVVGYISNTSGGGASVTSESVLPVDKWSHVALVYDGAMVQLYINGQPDGNSATFSGTPVSPSGYLGIGCNNDGTTGGCSSSYFAGILDEAFFINHGLGIAQIQEHYAQGINSHKN